MSELISYVIGVCMGAVIILTVFGVPPDSVVNQYHKAIDKCEAQLPRDQHCVITAIPKVIEDE